MRHSADPPVLDAQSARIVRWTRIGVWAFWGALLLLVLSSFASESAVRASPDTRAAQLSLLPQGWSFFTRDPREPKDLVYHVVAGDLVRLSYANTSLRNRLGASRSARAIDGELSSLLAPVLMSSWKECDGDPAPCVREIAAEPLRIVNHSTTRFICGEVAIVRSQPVPWAWSRSRDRIQMESRVLRLQVDCSQPRAQRYR